MLAFGLLLNTVGLGLFCWLIFRLAVYALPFFVAINAGIWAYHSGAGVLGTPLVAVAAGSMTVATCRRCGGVRVAGRICWLSCGSCDGGNWSAFACSVRS